MTETSVGRWTVSGEVIFNNTDLEITFQNEEKILHVNLGESRWLTFTDDQSEELLQFESGFTNSSAGELVSGIVLIGGWIPLPSEWSMDALPDACFALYLMEESEDESSFCVRSVKEPSAQIVIQVCPSYQ